MWRMFLTANRAHFAGTCSSSSLTVGFQHRAAGGAELDPIGLEAVEDRAVLRRDALAQLHDVVAAGILLGGCALVAVGGGGCRQQGGRDNAIDGTAGHCCSSWD